MNMYRHLWTQRRLGAWLDAELKPSIEDRVVAHLAKCRVCLGVVDELMMLKASLIRANQREDDDARSGAESITDDSVNRLRAWVGAGQFRGDN